MDDCGSRREGRHLRTVPLPTGRKFSLIIGLQMLVLVTGQVFRAIDKAGKVCAGFTEKVVWSTVLEYARALGKLAPHDLRRTYAKLCRASGGDLLEQIQLLLVQTTERYLGTRQNMTNAVNDNLGLIWTAKYRLGT